MKEFIPDINIDDLKIYYAATATDISRKEEVVFTKGSLYKKDDALVKISDVFDKTKTLSEKYNNKLKTKREKDIAAIKGKYMDLRAEEALLKAKIAAQSEEKYAQAQVYLEEANEWYSRSKEYGTKKINPYVEQIQKDIEDAQTYQKKKDKDARNKISDILQKASEIIKED